MARSKNINEIEKEIQEAETKAIEISEDIDINEVNKEAENISNAKVKIFDKQYKISDLINMTNKKKKTYEEVEITKKFKLLMRNYYEGIEYALLSKCCGRTYTIQDLKNKLKEDKSYELVDIRCSRNSIRFDKNTVDTVIKFAEEYIFKK